MLVVLVREVKMLLSMMDRQVEVEQATAVVAEERERHVSVVKSRMHKFPSKVHLLRKPLQEFVASELLYPYQAQSSP